MGYPLPENKPPPHCLGQNRAPAARFWIVAPTQPSSRIARSHHPTTSNPVYVCQIRFPLPENGPPYIALAKTEPWRLGFGIWLQLGPTPCALPDPTPPLTTRKVCCHYRRSLVPSSSRIQAHSTEQADCIRIVPIYIGEKATSCASTRNHPRTHNPILSATNATHTPSLPSLLLKPHLPVSPTLPPPVLLYIPSSPRLLSNPRPFPSSRLSTA